MSDNNLNKTIIDISLTLFPGSITYPNNPEVKFEALSTQSNVITKITFGSHSGTHIDAPFHAKIENGKTIDELNLDIFYGKARVLDFLKVSEAIQVSDLEQKNIQKGERVLLKTSNSNRFEKEGFFPDFVYLTPEGAEYLASKEVLLVGIDSLSIKQKGNPDNAPHTNLLSKQIPILEGLNFSKVEEGEYTLSAFPLKFIGIDGSPVRAILQVLNYPSVI
jgi:arylformamidase